MHKIVMGITLLIMEKSWNCVFEFLWESCVYTCTIHDSCYDFISLFETFELLINRPILVKRKGIFSRTRIPMQEDLFALLCSIKAILIDSLITFLLY